MIFNLLNVIDDLSTPDMDSDIVAGFSDIQRYILMLGILAIITTICFAFFIIKTNYKTNKKLCIGTIIATVILIAIFITLTVLGYSVK